MVKFESSMIIEIPFYDLDPMNVVWHGNYVKYLEEARCEMFKNLKYTYENMRKEGIAYPVAKMDLKFIKSCKFGQKIKSTKQRRRPEKAAFFVSLCWIRRRYKRFREARSYCL